MLDFPTVSDISLMHREHEEGDDAELSFHDLRTAHARLAPDEPRARLPPRSPRRPAVRLSGLRPSPRPARASRRRARGAAGPARRGAAQRLSADAGDRGALGRRLAPESGLRLPRAAAARGRGP